MGFSGCLELSPLPSLATLGIENLTGALHAEATRCRVSVNGIIQTEIWPGNHLTYRGQGMKSQSTSAIGRDSIVLIEMRTNAPVSKAKFCSPARLER